ncbi:MAG: methyltransferase domain-containing protein [Thermomicrobiales bacterium]
MNRQKSASDWANLDRTADPAAFVGYLDVVTGQAAAQAYKQETYALLRLNPGDRVLDVGCGAGDDARALAQLVAPTGQVIGVDASLTMVEEARRRGDGLDLPLAYHTGDAHRLDFADGTCDGARADRVFQHLDDPERALAELIRVTKPGGRIVVDDPDWGLLAVDAPDRDTTRTVLAEVAGAIRNPWMGRQLFGLFRRAELAEVTVVPATAVFTDYAQADRNFHLSDGLERALVNGAVTAKAAESWTRGLEEATATGQFLCALTAFIVAGQRS